MPATFPSHAGFVLPLKVWRPAWFDGVALVVGSALPDTVYVAGCCEPPQTYGHTWRGTLALVPVGLLLCWLVRWLAPTVAAHLPMAGPFALRDYGALGVVRHRWWVSVGCLWLGAFSHVLTDHSTHAAIEGTELGVPALSAEVVSGVPWWMVLHLLATALGAAVWLAVTLHIGRGRLLVRWNGPAPAVALHPRLFWGSFCSAALVGLAVLGTVTLLGPHDQLVGFLPGLPRPAVVVNRAAAALLLALALAVLAVRRPRGRRGFN